jgi:hypothetical protein
VENEFSRQIRVQIGHFSFLSIFGNFTPIAGKSGMVQFAYRRGNTLRKALRGVPGRAERHGGRSLQDFGRLNHAENLACLCRYFRLFQVMQKNGGR